MKRAMILAFASAALLLAACEEQKTAPTASPSGTAAAQKPTAAAAAPATAQAVAVAASDDIPSEADFEEEAEKDITADNLESELEKLEKEVAQ